MQIILQWSQVLPYLLVEWRHSGNSCNKDIRRSKKTSSISGCQKDTINQTSWKLKLICFAWFLAEQDEFIRRKTCFRCIIVIIGLLRLSTEKERIKDKYSEAEDLYEKSSRKLKRLMNSVKNENVNYESVNEVFFILYSSRKRWCRSKNCTKAISFSKIWITR